MHTSDDIPHLLVVDDDRDFGHLLERTLTGGGYRVTCAESGEQALDLLAGMQVDLVLLDINMPGIDGFETCRRIKSDSAMAPVPVIFMTGEGRTSEMVAQALSAGGFDYLAKPLSRVDVLARVRNAIQQRIESLWLRQWDAEDKVTGLPGRNYFKSRLEEELSESDHFNTPVSLVIAEFDGLEPVTTQHGVLPHDACDACAARFALLLRSESRRHDTVARLGESRFGLLLPRVGLSGAATTASHMSDIWRLTAVPIGETELSVPGFFAADGHDGASPPPSSVDLLRRAGEAMERVKKGFALLT